MFATPSLPSSALSTPLSLTRIPGRGPAMLLDGAGPGAHLHAAGALNLRLILQHVLLVLLGDLILRQEGDLLVLDPQHVVAEIDAHLVALEHVEAEQEVDVLALHDGEAGLQRVRADLDLGAVDAAEDFGGANAARDAAEAAVDETHDVAGLGGVGRHDGGLGAGVDEGFDGRVVDGHIDVEHGDAGEGFGVFLQGFLYVFGHAFLSDHLFDFRLGFEVKGVGVEEGELGFLFGLFLGEVALFLTPESVEFVPVVCGCGEVGLFSAYLFQHARVA